MKILIIGLGSIAKKHIYAIKKVCSLSEFFALRSDPNASKVEGITNIFSLDEVNTMSFDFAIISNPTVAHAETISSLIPFGFPLFIEKPIFSELIGQEILKEIQEKNIKTYVACNLRFLKSIQFAKKYVSNKRVNEVNIYCGSYLPEWRANTDFRKSYSANKQLGGGVHIDLIHEIDYARWMFGEPLRVNSIFSNKSSLNIDAWDYANYQLEYSNFNVSIILNYFRKDAKRILEIVFDDHTIQVDLLKNKVYKNNRVIFETKQTMTETYKAQIHFFIYEVVAKNKKFNTAHEAYQTLEICLRKD